MNEVPVDVPVIVGPGVVADTALLAQVAGRECAALGVRGTLVHARDAAHLLSLVRDGAVVVPGPEAEIRALIGRPLGAVVWVDVHRADGVEPGEGASHLHGRGISGLSWGIRHALHRVRHTPLRIPYGPSRDQWGDLYMPVGVARPPVVALVHGGYWRSIWAADVMEALCADLTGRGFAVWNLEYRRPDTHGWPATVVDVATGLTALRTGLRTPGPAPTCDDHPQKTAVPEDEPGLGLDPARNLGLDLDRVAVVGHSAGAQLALRAVADGPRAAPATPLTTPTAVSLVVSLAGVLDLVEGDRRWIGSGAVAAALGARSTAPADGGYGAGSPLLRVPIGVPQLIVQGAADDLDLIDFGRRYAGAAGRAGDDVTYLELPGDHFDVITPATPIWQATAEAIAAALA
ncbi:alpha/beta hydrolase [Nonomuraea sp. KC401]|uniref:alpha/beta hydrolase n=1 Tax=unclassified Nonomuraea TaxID=2593643 RepID=UPI0010FDF034|nr:MULTISPECIES: alpha/beta hydrolase [unclassified Nonomuraea]NBE97793.1 alpha/beta hydrolase fold domain-containing protein [Nonomuraea sp. K271]TLF58621.1 alpha/beta hydrolase [Nonomuraea sp. KC401]